MSKPLGKSTRSQLAALKVCSGSSTDGAFGELHAAYLEDAGAQRALRWNPCFSPELPFSFEDSTFYDVFLLLGVLFFAWFEQVLSKTFLSFFVRMLFWSLYRDFECLFWLNRLLHLFCFAWFYCELG